MTWFRHEKSFFFPPSLTMVRNQWNEFVKLYYYKVRDIEEIPDRTRKLAALYKEKKEKLRPRMMSGNANSPTNYDNELKKCREMLEQLQEECAMHVKRAQDAATFVTYAEGDNKILKEAFIMLENTLHLCQEELEKLKNEFDIQISTNKKLERELAECRQRANDLMETTASKRKMPDSSRRRPQHSNKSMAIENTSNPQQTPLALTYLDDNVVMEDVQRTPTRSPPMDRAKARSTPATRSRTRSLVGSGVSKKS